MYRNRTDGTTSEKAVQEQFWQGRRWRVFRCALVTADPDGLLRARVPSVELHDQLRTELNQVEGIFWPEGQPRFEYDLSDPGMTEELWRHASAVPAADPKAVVDFVDRWGTLGVGCSATVHGKTFLPETILGSDLAQC